MRKVKLKDTRRALNKALALGGPVSAAVQEERKRRAREAYVRLNTRHFIALTSFTDILRPDCRYVEGLTYQIRPGNDVLAAKVERWIEEGLVRYRSTPNRGTINATGRVGHLREFAALTHSTAARNGMADAVDAETNTGATDLNGDLQIRQATTQLVEIQLQDPAHTAAASSAMNLAGLPLSNTAAAAGTADNFQIRNNAVTYSGSITGVGGGGDLELNNTSIALSQNVQIDTWVYTAAP